VLSEALKLRFEAENLLRQASSRAQYSEALAKLANSRSLADGQAGLDELIGQARAGMQEAKR
jgi:hypothetical protein